MITRKICYDLVKIIAVYLVIFTHTGAMGSKLYTVSQNRIACMFYIALDVFRCINVPLFFMVSGALLLGKDESYKDIFLKRICKYVIVTVLASYFYSVFYLKIEWYNIYLILNNVYNANVNGMGHLWFLYAYIGLLIILPFLRKLVSGMTQKEYLYWLELGIAFKGIFPILGELTAWGGFGIAFHFSSDVIFYPVLGYYFGVLLSEKKYTFKRCLFLYGATIICIIVSVYMTWWDMKNNQGVYREKYLSSLIVIPTIAVFYSARLFELRVHVPLMIKSFINWLGQMTFGIYLFSSFLQIELKFLFKWLVQFMPSIFACLIYVAVVMVVGAGITALLRCIPILKKVF